MSGSSGSNCDAISEWKKDTYCDCPASRLYSTRITHKDVAQMNVGTEVVCICIFPFKIHAKLFNESKRLDTTLVEQCLAYSRWDGLKSLEMEAQVVPWQSQIMIVSKYVKIL